VASLLARDRQAFILERIRQDGSVRVADIATALRVSDMTIRRDIAALEQRGLVERMYGGACAPAPSKDVDFALYLLTSRYDQAELDRFRQFLNDAHELLELAIATGRRAEDQVGAMTTTADGRRAGSGGARR
jgi:predicted ArsR family transcriptional regulator